MLQATAQGLRDGLNLTEWSWIDVVSLHTHGLAIKLFVTRLVDLRIWQCETLLDGRQISSTALVQLQPQEYCWLLYRCSPTRLLGRLTVPSTATD